MFTMKNNCRGALKLAAKFVLSLIVLFPLYGHDAKAESYIGLQAGGSLGNIFASLKGDENTGYGSGGGAIYEDTKASDIKLENSYLIGAKAGHYFSSIPFLGLEAEVNYSEPDFKQQVVELSQKDLGTFKQIQLRADIYKVTTALNLMARYDDLKTVKPYIGFGPTLNYLNIKGTGRSGIMDGENPNDPSVGVYGPDIKESAWALGFQGKIGASVPISDAISFDAEYRYGYAPFKINSFRSLGNPSADLISNEVVAGLSYHF